MLTTPLSPSSFMRILADDDLHSLNEFYHQTFPKAYTGEASDTDIEMLDVAARVLQKKGWIPA